MIRVLVFIGLLMSVPAQAADFCDMNTTLASYSAAFKRKARGDVENAFQSFKKMAEAAVAPAQRHVAQYYLEESHEDMAIEKGIMWAQLAAWGGDLDAQKILKSAIAASRYSVVDMGRAWARDWRPQKQDCYGSAQTKTDDTDSAAVGRFPIIRSDGVSDEDFVKFGLRLQEALLIVDQTAPYFSSLVELIPAFEVIPGEGSDRYIQWEEDKDWVQVSIGYLHDDTVRQLSYALVLAVQRHLFDKIDDATFVDQISGRYGPIKIYGSLYGDTKSREFVDLFQKAIKHARELPLVLRDKVNFLDEIYYMPPSRYHVSSLSNHNIFASYDYKRSKPNKRMMLVWKKLAFEDEDQIVLELVKMGAQAQQQAMIEGMRGKMEGKKREDAILKALEGDMSAVQNMFTKQASKQKDLLDEWQQKGPDGIEKLYCEAVYAQVQAAVALKMGQLRVSRAINFKGCKKARAAWRTYLNNKE